MDTVRNSPFLCHLQTSPCTTSSVVPMTWSSNMFDGKYQTHAESLLIIFIKITHKCTLILLFIICLIMSKFRISQNQLLYNGAGNSRICLFLRQCYNYDNNNRTENDTNLWIHFLEQIQEIKRLRLIIPTLSYEPVERNQ